MARFDLLSRVYDHLPIPTHADALAERLAGQPEPRLDIGGGTGRFTERIHRSATRPLILDMSPGMLQRARRVGRAVDGVLGAGQAMPFEDGTFGAITTTEAFHHFAPHQAAVLADMARVLRPEGVLLIEEIDPGSVFGKLVELGENLVMAFGSVFLAPEALAELVSEHFGDVTVEPSGHMTYIVEAREPL